MLRGELDKIFGLIKKQGLNRNETQINQTVQIDNYNAMISTKKLVPINNCVGCELKPIVKKNQQKGRLRKPAFKKEKVSDFKKKMVEDSYQSKQYKI